MTDCATQYCSIVSTPFAFGIDDSTKATATEADCDNGHICIKALNTGSTDWIAASDLAVTLSVAKGLDIFLGAWVKDAAPMSPCFAIPRE